MAEQIFENSGTETYNPAITDWRSLVVLSPALGEDVRQEHADALRQCLADSASSLRGVAVELDETDTILVSFYSADSRFEAALNDGIASVCQAVRQSGIGDAQFVAMHLARELDIQVFGEEHFSTDECYVGQTAYDTYCYFTQAHEALDQLDASGL